MDECTIKALLELNLGPVTTEGKKVLLIPYEDILRGKISIRLNQSKTDTADGVLGLKVAEPPIQKVSFKGIAVPKEIITLYPNQGDKMAQDVVDYLKEISRCWEYKNLGFQTSLLKKAAKAKPALNTVICRAYGKDGDKYLASLVQDNFDYIKQCWSEDSN